ncbi:unnamed protein product [Heterobilharzia americana]|nr:unnamed protein product [Heterobilharzia americana]CAH8435686.1 unnamed protein product [Heterobilharzia americana]
MWMNSNCNEELKVTQETADKVIEAKVKFSVNIQHHLRNRTSLHIVIYGLYSVAALRFLQVRPLSPQEMN